MRRDSSDKNWSDAKEIVKNRDKNTCRLCRILPMQDFLRLRKNAGKYMNIIDPAHYRSVSERPDLCYETNNIVCLNRYSHSNLDDFKDPIDGHSISSEEVNEWWIRILKGNKFQYEFLLSKGLLKENDDAVSDN